MLEKEDSRLQKQIAIANKQSQFADTVRQRKTQESAEKQQWREASQKRIFD